MTKITYIPGEIANAAIDEHGNRKPVTRTQHIFDDAKGKSQSEVNAENDETLISHSSRLTHTEESILTEVEQRIAAEELLREELNAKQLEVGAVETDAEPVPNSPNHLTSGAIAASLGYYMEAPGYARAIYDSAGRLVAWIKEDGSVDWAIGVPTPVKKFVLDHLNEISTTTAAEIEGLQENKVDKQEGKNLIDERYIQEREDNEWSNTVLDSEGRIAHGIKKDGTFYAEKIESPTLDGIRKEINKDTKKAKLNIGVIVWDAQTGNHDAPDAHQVNPPSTNSIDYTNYLIFNDETFRESLRLIDGDTYDEYTNWRAYMHEKYGSFISADASFYEEAVYHDDIKSLVEDTIIRLSDYNSTDHAYFQNKNKRKPLDKITLDMLGDDATLDHDVTLGGWGCDGYHTTVYDGTEHIGSQDYSIVKSVTFHDTEKITAQIDLAAKFGIDFFCFYIEFAGYYFDESHSLEYIHLLMQNNSMNNFLYQFLNSPNKYKMKFCVMIGSLNNHDGDTSNPQLVMTSKKLFRLLEYIDKYLVSDSCYLHVDGKPVIQFYEQKTYIFDDNFLHIKNSQLVYQGGTLINNKDGIFSYGGNKPSSSMTLGTYATRSYSVLSKNNIAVCDRYDRYKIIMFPASMSWDDRPRWNYIVNSSLSLPIKQSYILPTEDEFFNHLVDVYNISKSKTNGDNVITIYAWNEFMEGGWLLPTQEDIDNDTWRNKLNAIKRLKVISNN